jgi:hypothetical protein
MSLTNRRIASGASIVPRFAHVSCTARCSGGMPHVLLGSHAPSSAWARSARSTSRVSSEKPEDVAGTRDARTAA